MPAMLMNWKKSINILESAADKSGLKSQGKSQVDVDAGVG